MDRCKTPPKGLPVQAPRRAPRHERRLPPLLSSHGLSRDFVADRLRRWGRSDAVEDAVIITGELFTNALTHAPSPEYIVAVDWNEGMIRLEMWDSSSFQPILRPLDLHSEHGRGIRMIAALSHTWGSRMAASGKCVWAVLPLTPHEFRE